MEKRANGRLGLTALLWRYLLTTGIVAFAIIGLWWAAFLTLMGSGAVLPANTAERAVAQTIQSAQEEFDGERIAHWYRWARFDEAGSLIDKSAMSKGQLRGIWRAYSGDSSMSGFPYGQYYAHAALPDGGMLILQYDYSAPYRSAWAQTHLPDFQICMAVLLLLLILAGAMLTTRRYTRILKRDAALLTAATEAIAAQRLDEPFDGGASVRELSAALEATEKLRQTLAASLGAQWAMEHRRSSEIAALAHDIKTPLAIISGNAELLAEDELTAPQRRSVGAIVHGERQIEAYLERLRALSAREGAVQRERVPLAELFEEWRISGEGLCAPKGIRFAMEEPPAICFTAEREAIYRAVLGMIDNAARFTPRNGQVTLRARAEDGMLALTVEDTGPGFSSEALRLAGYALYTEDASRPRDGHSGIGLCFARQTAQRHGGQLCLSNTKSGALAALTVCLNRTDCDDEENKRRGSRL